MEDTQRRIINFRLPPDNPYNKWLWEMSKQQNISPYDLLRHLIFMEKQARENASLVRSTSKK